MSYETKNIRNICLLGHGNSGKTSLAESMLFTTGAIDRQGKVSDGNTVCDYDAEEIKRQITISASVAPVEFGGCKINVLDCPGYFDFVGEALAAIRAVEAGVILCSAKDGISVGIPFLLPHMHDRYFFAADVLTVVVAYAYVKYSAAAPLTQFASLLGYHAYLKMRYLLLMDHGARALIVVLMLGIILFIRLLADHEGSCIADMPVDNE